MAIWVRILTASVFAIGISVWMLSGTIIVSGRASVEPTAEVSQSPAAAPFKVQVFHSIAQERTDTLSLTALSVAAERVIVSAETAGTVRNVPVNKGDLVRKGDVLCIIDPGARHAVVWQAQAAFDNATLQFQAAERLSQSAFISQNDVTQRRAALAQAQSELEKAKLDVENTKIIAPFDGVIQDIAVERGSFLGIGDSCATVVALDPMLVRAEVGEHSVGRLTPGMQATAEFTTGQTVTGTITFVSPAAKELTRTFEVEVEIANSFGTLRDGVTTRLIFDLPAEPAHRLPASAFVLNDDGELGVRAVNSDNVVTFHPGDLLTSAEGGGIWIGDLPKDVMIITRGQEFVVQGITVEPVLTDQVL